MDIYFHKVNMQYMRTSLLRCITWDLGHINGGRCPW